MVTHTYSSKYVKILNALIFHTVAKSEDSCIKYEYGFSLTLIFPYKDEIFDFVLIHGFEQENSKSFEFTF